jgi:hypothetical protein
MAFPKSGTFKAPGAPTKVPAPGATPSSGLMPRVLPKPPPAKKINTRDYGKPDIPAPVPQPSPFGPGEM